jgi:hypothetical protein
MCLPQAMTRNWPAIPCPLERGFGFPVDDYPVTSFSELRKKRSMSNAGTCFI